MACFYNPILTHFLEIGLVACSRRHHGPAAIAVRKFAFFLRNSQISQNRASQKRQKSHF
jgi:hypothetical protein